MRHNDRRFDLSNRLIHFFREVDLEGDSAPELVPEHFAFNEYVEGTRWPALFLLRRAVRSHRIWATWSIRRNARTIYGPHPATCFTEMPIAAFIETARHRESAGQAMSSYALTFPKSAMHEIGAMPVIYGLSDRNYRLPQSHYGMPRLLAEGQLPLQEQYRYVTFDPSGSAKIDWSHEREWRIPYRGDLTSCKTELADFGCVEDAAQIPALEIADRRLEGIGIIVKSKEDALKLRHDVLSLIDQNIVSRTHFDHILVLDQLPSVDALRSPDAVEEEIRAATLRFDEHFDLDSHDVTAIENEFSNLVASVERDAAEARGYPSDTGGCWLWFHENSNPYVRALIQAGRISVNREGRYLAELRELHPSRELNERQDLADVIGQRLKAEHGISASSFAVLRSFDANAVPFFIRSDAEGNLFYNCY